ncbi:MAG: nodulation protein NfeD [Myxococcales bacterium]|nr:nodulation protein NfeD [Myxococcales bacterium]
MLWLRRRRCWIQGTFAVLAASWLVLFGLAAVSGEGGGGVDVVTIDGTINSGSAGYLLSAIEQAEADGAECLVVELDTPGGALKDTEDMVKRMLSAKVPVVVFVWPKAAQAASAGTFITMAAHVAVMAPGTRIGAAHPVSLPLFPGQGDEDQNKKPAEGEQKDIMMEKVENDTVSLILGIAKERGRNEKWAEDAVRKSFSITADVALAEKVIDLIAEDLPDLLEKIDGREVRLAKDRTVTLKTRGARVRRIEMSLKQKLLNFLADPNILMVLFSLGGLGILMEFYHPGTIFPGAVGAVCLLLAFTSMQVIPIRAGGLLLMLVGIGLFVAEVYVSAYGLLGIAGAVLFALGGVLLVDPASQKNPYYIEPGFSVDLSVILPLTIAVAAIFLYIGYFVIRAQRRRIVTGEEGMLGLTGEARSEVNSREGRVFVRGEIWMARAAEPIPAGSKVRVVKIEGLLLHVIKAD